MVVIGTSMRLLIHLSSMIILKNLNKVISKLGKSIIKNLISVIIMNLIP